MLIKRLSYLILAITLFSSCAQKVYFFDAHKLSSSQTINPENLEIHVNSFFAGDALDYVIFELDVENNSSENVNLSYRNIYLEVYEGNGRPVVLDALNKDDVIRDLEVHKIELQRAKKARDIGNAVDIGINLMLIGSSGGTYAGIDALLYSTDMARFYARGCPITQTINRIH